MNQGCKLKIKINKYDVNVRFIFGGGIGYGLCFPNLLFLRKQESAYIVRIMLKFIESRPNVILRAAKSIAHP